MNFDMLAYFLLRSSCFDGGPCLSVLWPVGLILQRYVLYFLFIHFLPILLLILLLAYCNVKSDARRGFLAVTLALRFEVYW